MAAKIMIKWSNWLYQ